MIHGAGGRVEKNLPGGHFSQGDEKLRVFSTAGGILPRCHEAPIYTERQRARRADLRTPVTCGRI
jgi:hypothetical protein